MPSIHNETIELHVQDDGFDLLLRDRRRGVAWRLDPSTCGFATSEAEMMQDKAPVFARIFSQGRARPLSGTAIELRYPVPGGEVLLLWELRDDHALATLEVRSDQILEVAFPGSFQPEAGAGEVLLPRFQGLLTRPVGPDRYHRWKFIGMNMLGYLQQGAGLLVAEEDPKGKVLLHGLHQGRVFGLFASRRCPVRGWTRRQARVYPTDGSITAVCKRYRRRVIERGDFVSWEQKIQNKPILDKLFGSLIAFIGYNQARETDYVQSARKLRDSGFESVLYYPVCHNNGNSNFLMGGDKPIALTPAQIQAIKDCGGLISAWNWTTSTLDDGSEAISRSYRLDQAGQLMKEWQIDQFMFNKVCTSYQIEFARRQYQGAMREMDWAHYDVSALDGGCGCWNPAHAEHHRGPLSAGEDALLVGELLGPGVNGNRIVSSEGFTELAARHYDIGSNKYVPGWGDEHIIPVPMTSLVFHDSTLNNWWELHTYNEVPSFAIANDGAGNRGAGWPEKKAAMDALYGAAPLVFPFGRQYGWLDIATHKTFSFEIHLEDAEVQRALRAALPVSRLHRRIGKLEMTGFEFLTEDFAVQATTFADGTRIVANVSDGPVRTSDFGTLPPNSWKEARIPI